jgi:hypothetical protein
VPTAAVTDPAQREQLADCPDGTSKCVPDPYIETNGKFLAKTCRSLSNAEGRCLSVCIPQIDSQKDRLPQDICGEGELCAPCYDPTTGELTGACSVSCDTGPKEPAVTFGACCNGVGSCVPTSLVTAEQQALLGKDTCTGADQLCAPNELTDSSFIPPTCRSVADAEGRCMAACLPDVASQADRLPQGTCASTHLCAPCYDPLTGELTGACNQNGDAPVEPPKTFDKCCHDLGSCVPQSLVPTDQRSQLSLDSCATGELCAPTSLTDTSFKPPSCRSLIDAEGRCLPDCLASIQAQKDRLPKSTCEEFHLCAPCYDPVGGQPTGACEQNGDRPAEPPKTFPKCCDGIGGCVPTTLIPTEQQGSLGTDICTGQDVLCVPSELSDSSFIPATCDSLGGAEGRCLPSCLPDVSVQKDRLPQATCPATHRCAPCYDPISGEQTAACTQNGDSPKEPPLIFQKCCALQSENRGTCVPKTALTPSQASSLPQDTCPNDTWACVPNLKVADPTAKFPTCDAGLLGPGACVPNCIITDPVQLLLLTQGTCQAGELCAPCDALGSSTGACD